MGVEIVSPPMPLPKCVKLLPAFFEWVDDSNGYANESTGFHMSVSMPNHKSKKLDFVKLALFLGDKHVLGQFERFGNEFCESVLGHLENTVEDGEFANAMNKFKSGLDKIAEKAVLAKSSGLGKYFSVNPRAGYVEFRSAGGENYTRDVGKIEDTLVRYAMALAIAMDPAAHRAEYAKKLYKMLTDNRPSLASKDIDIISFFSKYAAGEINRGRLMYHLNNRRRDREYAAQEKKNREMQLAKAKTMTWRVSIPDQTEFPRLEIGDGTMNMPDAKRKALIQWGLEVTPENLNRVEAERAFATKR
jgi:hypothetical protein